MYYYIKGILKLKENGFAVLENNGTGYKLTMSDTSLNALKTGEQTTVYTYLYVREDIMELYGFNSIEEKNMFQNLISISGIGAKAAIAVLSVGTPQQIASAVITNDAKFIQKAQGIGAKTAQRVILELHDKIECEDLNITENIGDGNQSKMTEAVSALTVLGYSEREAAEAIRGIDMSLDTEEIIRRALGNLFKGV